MAGSRQEEAYSVPLLVHLPLIAANAVNFTHKKVSQQEKSSAANKIITNSSKSSMLPI
jgi:hypothetical protein